MKASRKSLNHNRPDPTCFHVVIHSGMNAINPLRCRPCFRRFPARLRSPDRSHDLLPVRSRSGRPGAHRRPVAGIWKPLQVHSDTTQCVSFAFFATQEPFRIVPGMNYHPRIRSHSRAVSVQNRAIAGSAPHSPGRFPDEKATPHVDIYNFFKKVI